MLLALLWGATSWGPPKVEEKQFLLLRIVALFPPNSGLDMTSVVDRAATGVWTKSGTIGFKVAVVFSTAVLLFVTSQHPLPASCTGLLLDRSTRYDSLRGLANWSSQSSLDYIKESRSSLSSLDFITEAPSSLSPFYYNIQWPSSSVFSRLSWPTFFSGVWGE